MIEFIIALTVIILLYYYGRRGYKSLENCGFPVVEPISYLGSDPFFYKDVQHEKDVERFHKYGRLWGLYMGKTPQVFITDPVLIKKVFTTDYEYFHNRREIDFGYEVMNEILDFMPAEKWKTVRSMLSPLFTTSKLKAMAAVMEAHAAEYINDLKMECKNTGSIKYDTKTRLTCWLIDMFAQSTLGIKLQDRKNPDNPVALAFRQLIGEDMEFGLLYSLSMTFPFLTKFAPSVDGKPMELIETTFSHILEQRRQNPNPKSTDFVDVLNGIDQKVGTPDFKRLGITHKTVVAQAINFFLGGYETSSTSLSHLLYYLAKYPDVQSRLYDEIFTNFSDTPINHETIKDERTSYLTACLTESLRLAPPVKPERICTKDWTYDGIRIPKGTEIVFPAWAIHRNPKYFPEPEIFRPERFLGSNKNDIDPFAFVTFGHGPRNCIGMRFAYDSIKILLIHLILNFQFQLRDDTKINYKKGSLLFVCFDPLYLDLVQRKN